MIPPRVIPVLQLSGGFLVKTTRFGQPMYVGDPINAVKIFNDKGADELILCDIDATAGRSPIDYGLLEDIASEAFMPVGYGGAVADADIARRVIGLGMEKVVVNTLFDRDPDRVDAIAAAIGSQSVVASVDVQRGLLGRRSARVAGGTAEAAQRDPVEFAKAAVAHGAGEVLVHSVDRDGAMSGYDLDAVRAIAEAVPVPVVALGGAGTDADFSEALRAGASAVAAGSRFIFHGKRRAVLITYPDQGVIRTL